MILVASFKDDESDVINKILEMIERDAEYELIATVPHEGLLSYNHLIIDSLHRKVTRNGEEISLTCLEFNVLYLLAKKPGRVYTKE